MKSHRVKPVYEAALFTHRGTVRPTNEDAILADGQIFSGDMRDVWSVRLPEGAHTFIVADGIGGQPHGRQASHEALRFLSRSGGQLQTASGCEQALHSANHHLYSLMFTPGRIGMGTTVVGVTVQQSGLITFNVGDSRAYLLSSHGLTILSQDDVPETTEGGGRTRSTHEITQALGGSETPLAVLPHVSIRPALAEEDRLLLCTDGLTDVIDDSEIEGTLMLPAPSQVIVETLIRKAVRSGSRDNVSVLLLARAP